MKLAEYTDYRKFIRDYFAEAKKSRRGFSQRAFCIRSGVSSPSFFLEVIQGKRNLSDRALSGCIKALKLNENDARYFGALVGYNQAKKPVEKIAFLEIMRGLRKRITHKVVPLDLYDYYRDWYNAVVREQACLSGWKDDFRRLARSITPAISAEEARKSVYMLLRLGFIKKTPDGCYVQSDPAITTGSEVFSPAIREFNRQMASLGEKAVNSFGPEKRDISSMIIGISKESYALAKEEIQDFKERIKRIVIDDSHSDCVYNLNVQLFPVAESMDSIEETVK